MGGRLPLARPSPEFASPGRVGDRLPSRDGTLLGGADSTCAPRHAARAPAAGTTATGTDDCRSRRCKASAADEMMVERGDTLLEAEVGEAREPAIESARAAAAASAPAPVGADSAWGGALRRGSEVRQASDRGRSRARSALPPAAPSSADPLLLGGSVRPKPAGCGSGGSVGVEAPDTTDAIAASRPGLAVSVRAALRSSRLANSWFSGMRFSCSDVAGDRMPLAAGDSAPLPMPSGDAAASRPAVQGAGQGASGAALSCR